MIEPVYSAAENRYECGMQYRRAGRSGVTSIGGYITGRLNRI